MAQNAAVSVGQGEAQQVALNENLEKYAGFTPTKVEAIFSLFKERDNKEKMSSKCYGPVQWVLDLGASHHMTFNRNIFSKFSKLPAAIYVTIPNGEE